MIKAVLDASALLALLNDEPGAKAVARAIPDAAIGAVNASEAAGKLAEAGMPEEAVREAIEGLGRLTIVPFDLPLAYSAGMLRPITRRLGLTLGDRACLALGLKLGVPILTTDRSGARLKIGARIQLVR